MKGNHAVDEELKKLKKEYEARKDRIFARAREFAGVMQRNKPDEIFSELCFCLLTPQSKATNCWKAVCSLNSQNLLFSGTAREIQPHLVGVRFHKTKAERIILARNRFEIVYPAIMAASTPQQARDILVKNIKGIGYKEASHFLRNVGLGEGLAILDRHILRNLKKFRVIRKIPNSLTKRQYLLIEKKMLTFARKVNIPCEHLDMLFWASATGYIFK